MSRGNLALLVVAALAALMMLIWAQSYAGRVQLRDSQLRGCERGKLDRAGNATGWRTAEAARRRTRGSFHSTQHRRDHDEHPVALA
jgi:hypothetical protein